MQQHRFFTASDTPSSPPADTGFDSALNPAQLAAATHGEGPILVIAGAGSGKTRTLVYRMAHLVRQGVPPESILLLTFTRRAAQEMLSRAGQLTGQSCRRVVGGTFHATSNILLRQYGHHLGINANFTIIDRGDSEGIINLIKSSLGMAGAGKRFPSKRVILNLISGSINKATTIDELVFSGHIHLSEFVADIHTIQDHYRQFKHNHGLLDYDDLLVYWKRLLAESEHAREAMSDRFRYLLVDEYQDTNLLQAEIVRLLACRHSNVMVVGDDAQSIYSFRGADFYNIMRFADQFPGTRVVKLEENYRSTQPILQLTNSIISNAAQKFTKTLFSAMTEGARPQVVTAANESAEARFIVQHVNGLRQEGTPLHHVAVLFRSGYHSYKLEIELASQGIDFDKRGGLKLTESAHIKDVLSFFRVIINPWDNLSWNRILLQLEKVGPKTVHKILAAVRESDTPLEALGAYKPAPAWKEQFERLTDTLARISQANLTPSDQFDLVLEYYLPVFERMYYDDYPKRRKELDQIKALISGYGDLRSFVDDTALDPPEIDAGTNPFDDDRDRLVLSTIHSAKGLEWDTVFVIGLAEGRFPHQNAVPGDQWEEERRLLYVAATRAKKELFLTFPRELVTSDRQNLRTTMSPFLREINAGLYQKHDPSPAAGLGIRYQPPPAASQARVESARTVFSLGMEVRHPFFGIGTVTSIPGPRRVEVLFDRHGSKILHLDYAQLEPIG